MIKPKKETGIKKKARPDGKNHLRRKQKEEKCSSKRGDMCIKRATQ